MADQTTVYGYPGDTPSANLSLALTTTEKAWQFEGLNKRPMGVLGYICDAAWLYSSRPGGPYFPIPAGTFVNFPITHLETVYVKAATGTATLSVVVTG